MERDLGQFKLTFPNLWCCNIYGLASSLILHFKACVGLEGVSRWGNVWFIPHCSPAAPPYLTSSISTPTPPQQSLSLTISFFLSSV